MLNNKLDFYFNIIILNQYYNGRIQKCKKLSINLTFIGISHKSYLITLINKQSYIHIKVSIKTLINIIMV